MKDSDKLEMDRDSTEVELSAQDLFALSPSAEQTASPASTIEATSEKTEPQAPRARRRSAAAIAMMIGAVAAAAAAFAVIVPMDRSPEPVQAALAPQPAPVVEETAPLEVEGPPVLFKNPFDATEVFEFPPGTSREEARAAVADLLIMRAQERQAMFEAQSKTRKQPSKKEAVGG